MTNVIKYYIFDKKTSVFLFFTLNNLIYIEKFW